MAPFDERYLRRRETLSRRASRWGGLLFRRGLVPPLYGVGLDERAVEWPWAVARLGGGAVLDAGGGLNHPHLEPLLPPLHVVSLDENEPRLPRFAYTTADLRSLPFADGAFETTLCLSTLEHVGMDNTRYGVDAAGEEDPHAAQRRALLELVRVTRGRVLLTVPVGRPSDHGWFFQHGADSLGALLEGLDARVEVYRSTRLGWRRTQLADVAGAGYAEGVPAAPAVACVTVPRR